MLFNSLEFIVFFIIVVPLYFILPHRYSWVLLLAASYIFYMFWKPAYILLIVLSTIVDYIAARLMSNQSEKSKRKKYLVMSLISNLGILFVFKYFNFLSFTIEGGTESNLFLVKSRRLKLFRLPIVLGKWVI